MGELLPKTRTKAIHPKLMETPFLANHVCLEGFEDVTKAKEYISDFGEEVAKLLEPFSMTKIKMVKENKNEGFYIGRFKELKNMKPKAIEGPSKSKEPSKPGVDGDKKQTAQEKDTIKVEVKET